MKIPEISDRLEFIMNQKNVEYILEKKDRVGANRVNDCQSALWINGRINDNKVYYKFFSEGIFPNGIANLLIGIVNGTNFNEIIEYNPIFIEKTKISGFISPGRKVGIQSLFNKIREIAIEVNKNARNY